jgi:general secretion pathway protein H
MIWHTEPRQLYASQAGFTLIEILAVLTVLGLMLGLLITRGPMRNSTVETRSFTSGFAEALRLTRSEAIARNRPVAFSVDTLNRIYRPVTAPVVSIPADINLRLSPISARQSEAGHAWITFKPDGSSTGARVDIIGRTRRMRIEVDWLTGRVAVHDS